MKGSGVRHFCFFAAIPASRTICGTLLLFLNLVLVTITSNAVAAPQILFANGAPLGLDIGKGVVVRLDHACASVFVSDPAIADVQLESPTMLSISAKAPGEATVYAIDGQDHVLFSTVVDVHADVSRLQRQIDQLAPGSAVRAQSVADSIVLTGPLKDAGQGDDIRKLAARYVANPANVVDQMSLDKPNEINLQVRVAEISRTVLKQFGINWDTIAANGASAFGAVSSVPALIGTAGVAAGKAIPMLPNSFQSPNVGFNVQDSTLLGSGTNNNIFAGVKSGRFQINALVDALAQQGLLTILAEPNLTTVSGQKASFLAGGEFPVPVPQSTNGSTAIITIDWKQFGVSLTFTPTILGNDRIALQVAPEVSELAPNQGITLDGFSIPGITTRKADTAVELGSGQSFVIAGLLQNQTQQQLQAFPWLGDLPVIGALFRSTAFQRGDSELVIIVTPYLVAPVSSATALQTGLEGFIAPSDADRVLNGKLNAGPVPATPDGVPGPDRTPGPSAVLPPSGAFVPTPGRTAATAIPRSPAGISGFEMN